GEVGVQDRVHRLAARGAIGAAILHALVIAVLAVVLGDLEVLAARGRARLRGGVGVADASLGIDGRAGRSGRRARLGAGAEIFPALLEERVRELARGVATFERIDLGGVDAVVAGVAGRVVGAAGGATRLEPGVAGVDRRIESGVEPALRAIGAAH